MRVNTKLESFESAIVDGINIYVRDVLIAKGIIPSHNVDALMSDLEINRLKHEIAVWLATQWAQMPMID